VLGGSHPGQHEDAGADYAADAEEDEVGGPEGFFELLSGGPFFEGFDVFGAEYVQKLSPFSAENTAERCP
jgi:hypothetical protein